jgi:CheY-like chemotaxis protein
MAYSILVVDDNDINLYLLAKILELEAYQVFQAHNGMEALQAVRQNVPDLALLDVMMPDINGYELCRKLRQPPFNAQFPIVMLTAMNSEFEKEEAQAAGANDVWSKPFDMDLLRQQIGTLLSDQKTRPIK